MHIVSIICRRNAGFRSALLGTLAIWLTGCANTARLPMPTAPANVFLPPLQLQLIAGALPEITSVTHAGDGSGRLFLSTQRGKILIIDNGVLLAEPLLDLTAIVKCCGEQGLLGLAFDPNFRDNHRFYVSYTDQQGASTVARYRLQQQDGTTASTAEILLRSAQPTAIHNGGALAFGQDGYLYIALGDGGHFGTTPDNSGRDPDQQGQRLDTLLGKILRIDVATPSGYRIPANNPFRQTPGARAEIWASGLRNPWRMSFDRRSGDLFIADVGPSQWEEINLAPRGVGGHNFGWSAMLGPDCFAVFRCDPGQFTPPILTYDHDTGCAIIGGYRYRGSAINGLNGTYLYGDFCSGAIWGGIQQADGHWQATHLHSSDLRISTFGEDEAGELYVVHYGSKDGALYRLTATGKE